MIMAHKRPLVAAKTQRPPEIDAKILADAILRAESILADYIDPGPRDCSSAINRLLETIDRDDVISAARRVMGQDLPRPA
jgi:hypothetical protein